MAVRLIALDIDGTLLDSRWQLPEANRQAIAEATRRGIEVALVTGRRYDFAMPVARKLDSPLTMIDVINPVCSKGSSLAEWAALRGFAREEVMAIGDNHNDLEMLSFAGIPVVMGNSVPALKTYGWHETGTNDENGVALAIEQFALREAAPCL